MGRPWLAGFDRTDVIRGVVALLVSTFGLAVAGWLLPGIAFEVGCRSS